MPRARSAAGAILFTYLAARAFWWVTDQPWRLLDVVWIEGLLKGLVWVVPAVLILIGVRRLSLHEAFRELGLDSSMARGYGFGLLATMPMVLTLPFGAAHSIDPAVFVGTVLLGAGVVGRHIPLVLAIVATLVLLTVWASEALRRRLAPERETALPSDLTPVSPGPGHASGGEGATANRREPW